MEVLLFAATRFEIEPTIQYLASENINNIDIVVTGVGLTSATYQITKAVSHKRPTLMLQAGIAGTFDSNLKLGSVVLVESETIGDLGVMEKGMFRSIFDMKLVQYNDLPWSHGRLLNTSDILNESNLAKVRSVSINEITTLPSRIEHYKSSLRAAVESMEGAALHYVGLMENIPFLQVRSLSNFVGERDKSKWHIKEAIENLNKELIQIILKLVRL